MFFPTVSVMVARFSSVTFSFSSNFSSSASSSSSSSSSAFLWLSTSAVQLTVPIGDDGQLMSSGPPDGPSYDFVQAQFNFFFACGALFSVLFVAFLFSVRQTFPLAFRSSFPFCFPLVTFLTVGSSEA